MSLNYFFIEWDFSVLVVWPFYDLRKYETVYKKVNFV